MAKSAQKQSLLRVDVNLLHPHEIPAKLPVRFLHWLISYGRFIVILVEVLVVVAFVMRFKLDAQLDDLKQKINLDLPYVKGLTVDEALIKQTQLRLSTIDQTFNSNPKWQDLMDNLNAEIPTSIHFSNLAFDHTDPQSLKFRITASTQSNTDLSVFLNNLRTDDQFSDVNLASISFDQNEIDFSITGSVKK